MVYDIKTFALNRFASFVIPPSDAPWSGLIYHLSKRFDRNVHEKGVVEITCSLIERTYCWHIVNYDWDDYLYANNSANSWFQFEFKDQVVSLTDDGLTSVEYGRFHLFEWPLAGSMDYNEWIILDHQKTQILIGKYITKIFHCNDSSSGSQFHRYIRSSQTMKNSSGSYYLLLSNIEFFGPMLTFPVNSVTSEV
jgi:hypothetical protein